MIGRMTLSIGKPSEKQFYLLLALFVLAYIPWLILGGDSYIEILDNLDSESVYLHLLSSSDVLFDYSPGAALPQVMNGLPRIALRTGLNVTVLLYNYLPTVYAYIINHMLVHLVGFAGMYLFLRRYVAGRDSFVPLLVALLFGLVSYYHAQYGISISGQPLLLFSFLNILTKRDRWFDWLYICFFPFYSFLVVTLPFFLPFLALIWLWWGYRHQHYSLKFVLAAVLLVAINVVVEYPLIKGVLSNELFVSHRESWDYSKVFGGFSVEKSFSSLLNSLLFTQYHAGRIFTFPIIALLLFVWLSTKKICKTELLVLFILIFFGVWSSFNDWFIFKYQHDFKWLKIIAIDRFFFIAPFLWFVLMALLLCRLSGKGRGHRAVGILCLIGSLAGVLYFNKEFVYNARLLLTGSIKEPTFNQFYAEEIFEEIKEEIKEDIGEDPEDFRVVSIGIYPNIAQYNGFYTLDSYQNNYPLAYKKEFRQIIAPEIAQDEALRVYYDSWGSRAYVFVDELGKEFEYGKTSNLKIPELDLDFEKFKYMGGEYIISSVPITDTTAPVQLEGTFQTKSSYWKLYLYRVE